MEKLADRAHGIVGCGDSYLVARQSGLYQISAAGEASNLFRSWSPDSALACLAVARDAQSGSLLAGIPGGVAQSEDGGASWQMRQFRAPPPLATCLALSSDFARDGCALAGSLEDGIFRTSDGGRSWMAVNHGLFDHSIYSLALSPHFAQDGIAYAGAGSGIYRSQNGGRLWRDLVMPAGDETVLSLALGEDGALYAGCEAHGILRTDDGGKSWVALLEADGAVNAVAVGRGSTVFAQVDDQLLQSRDGGTTWQDGAAQAIDCMALDESGEVLLLALADGGAQRRRV